MADVTERCGHDGEDVVLEYAVDGDVRRFVSCGLPACNDAGAAWLAAQEWAAAQAARNAERSGNPGELEA